MKSISQYSISYRLFKWIGNNIGFKGLTYLERYDYLNELENQLGEKINDTPTNTWNWKETSITIYG